MEQLERFLLIASGDDLAGTLSNPGAQVRLHVQLPSSRVGAMQLLFRRRVRSPIPSQAQQRQEQYGVVAELLAIGDSVASDHMMPVDWELGSAPSAAG